MCDIMPIVATVLLIAQLFVFCHLLYTHTETHTETSAQANKHCDASEPCQRLVLSFGA